MDFSTFALRMHPEVDNKEGVYSTRIKVCVGITCNRVLPAKNRTVKRYILVPSTAFYGAGTEWVTDHSVPCQLQHQPSSFSNMSRTSQSNSWLINMSWNFPSHMAANSSSPDPLRYTALTFLRVRVLTWSFISATSGMTTITKDCGVSLLRSKLFEGDGFLRTPRTWQHPGSPQ